MVKLWVPYRLYFMVSLVTASVRTPYALPLSPLWRMTSSSTFKACFHLHTSPKVGMPLPLYQLLNRSLCCHYDLCLYSLVKCYTLQYCRSTAELSHRFPSDGPIASVPWTHLLPRVTEVSSEKISLVPFDWVNVYVLIHF